MHFYQCQFCKKDNSAELYSLQMMTAYRRFGWDYYHCHSCGVNYVIYSGESECGFAIKTDEKFEDFFARAQIESHRRFIQDLKRKERETSI